MMRIICVVGLSGALALSACSSSSGNSGAGGSGGSADGGQDAATDAPTGVMISGTAAPHPLTAGLDPTASFTMINVAVVDPAIVIANPAAPPLAGAALDTSTANCATTGCAWSFNNVDISHISLGLVGILDDQRTTGRVWVKTGTGAGAGDFVMMHNQTKEPITNRPLFAVSTMSEAKLAAFAAAALSDATIVAGSLTGRGFMIGSILGKPSAGAMPVAGATLTPADASKVNILYPSADFMSAGTSTSATGTVLVVPKAAPAAAVPVVTSWSVTAPTGDTRTWTALTAGSTPGTAFVILFAANETP
jgi:hypothetical protein